MNSQTDENRPCLCKDACRTNKKTKSKYQKNRSDQVGISTESHADHPVSDSGNHVLCVIWWQLDSVVVQVPDTLQCDQAFRWLGTLVAMLHSKVIFPDVLYRINHQLACQSLWTPHLVYWSYNLQHWYAVIVQCVPLCQYFRVYSCYRYCDTWKESVITLGSQ